MGGCPMGGYGWGTVSEKDLIRAVHASLDMGLNFFDTADIYGIGHSELTLGKALKGKKANAFIATKFGVRIENGKTFYDNSPQWIESAVAGSLRRLGVDHIDIYQIHYRDGITSMETVIEALEKEKAKGNIRYYGVSNVSSEDISELLPYKGYFVSFQNEYSLACRKNEKDNADLSRKIEMTPLTWGSLGQGILTGKYDIHSVFGADDRRSREAYVNFHGEKLKKNLEIVEVLKEISEATGHSIPSITIRFILDFVSDSAVIVGTKNEKQNQSNMSAFGWKLTNKQIEMVLEVSEDDAENKERMLSRGA
jgi:aryl-alcohol dehydrogenase-like predicted oxidoreductase